MLSRNGQILANELRSYVGADGIGLGPDRWGLTELWKGMEPAALRPAIEELARMGFIVVDRVLSGGDARGRDHIPDEFNLRDIAGVQVLEDLLEYFRRAEDRPASNSGACG